MAEGEHRKPLQPDEWAPDGPEGYEDLVRIDQGGFATIYRARDTRFDRAVALKVLHSDNLTQRQLRRFRTECMATGRVVVAPEHRDGLRRRNDSGQSSVAGHGVLLGRLPGQQGCQ